MASRRLSYSRCWTAHGKVRTPDHRSSHGRNPFNDAGAWNAAPAFALPDLTGKTISSDDFRSAPALLAAFICPHCPYVRHIRSAFAQFASEYAARGLQVVAINANDTQQFPDDGPEGMKLPMPITR